MTMTATRTGDYGELIKEDRVHGRLYYDPVIFQEEMDKIVHKLRPANPGFKMFYKKVMLVNNDEEMPLLQFLI